MKNSLSRFYLIAAFAGLVWFGGTTTVFAAAQDRRSMAERLERLEQNVHELAQRQEQLMQRLGAAQEGRRPTIDPRGGDLRPMPGAVPAPVAAKALRDVGGIVRLTFLVWILCNILLTIWIYTDIRKRGEGSGIFVALALVAGIPTAIIYAITRIGEKKA